MFLRNYVCDYNFGRFNTMNLNKEQSTIFLKCVEELNELAAVLMQQINKPHKRKRKSILSEISDVELRIKNLKDIL